MRFRKDGRKWRKLPGVFIEMERLGYDSKLVKEGLVEAMKYCLDRMRDAGEDRRADKFREASDDYCSLRTIAHKIEVNTQKLSDRHDSMYGAYGGILR